MSRKSSNGIVWLLVVSLAVCGFVHAANNDWTGALSSLVSNPGNWSLGHVPTSSEGHRVHAGFITGSKTVTFDTVLRPNNIMFWCGAYAAQENNVVIFDPATGVCDPIIFEATDPTNGISQTGGTGGHLRFCDNDAQNLALRIRGGTYATTSELWLGIKGKAWFFVEDGALSCGGICYIANNANAYSDVTLAGGTLTTGGDLTMGGSGATARLTVGSGDPAKSAVVTVPLNKWAILSNHANVQETTLTLKAGGAFHCGFLRCSGANSTVVFDGGTFVKDDDVMQNATSQGYVLGFGGNDAQDTVGRRVLFTENGGTLELTKADGWIKSEVALADGATAATLTKRGRGVLRLGNLGEGLSAVIEDGGIEVTQGQFEQVTITGGKIPLASVPAHKGRVVVTGGKILLPVPFDGLTDGTAVVTTVNVADFDFQNGLTAADVFVPAGSLSLYAFTLGVNGEGLVTLTPTRRALPRGYTAVDYIESNGHQYINTGWIHSSTTRVECVLNASDPGWEWRAAFGARNVTFRTNCFLFFTRNGDGNVCYSRTNNEMVGTGDSKVFPYGEKVKIVCERCYSTWTWTANGEEKTGGVYTTGVVDDGVSPLFIFGLNAGTSATALAPQMTSRACQKLYGFRISEGETVVRDFVPVLSPRGEPGLYDFVTQSFYADGCGEEGFTTPSVETAFCTGYIDSSDGKAQYINTGYIHKSNTKVETEVNVGAARSSTSWEAIFGSRKTSMSNNAMIFFAWANMNPRSVYNRSGAETPGGPIFSGVRTFLTCEGQTATWYQVGNPSQTGSITTTGTANDGVNGMYIFDLNKHDSNGNTRDNSYLRMQLYSFKISEGSVVKRDFVGYHKADGTVGLVDLADANKTFYPSANGVNFLFGGARYQLDGTALTALNGEIPAARFAGVTTITKKDLNLANVAAAPTSLAALTVSEGGLTFQDGVAKTYAISGALTLKGDAALTLDVTVDGADRFTVGSLVLDASVTAELPVKINLAASGVAEVAEPITLIAGANLTTGDLAKFALFSDIPAQLAIENGDLQVVAKEVGAVTFIGGGANGNWSTAENWQDGEKPQTGAKVNVAATADGTMVMDVADLSVKTLQYGADAGIFTFGGSALGITTAITNLSTAAQTLTLPLTLGVGQDFSISTTGDMALTGQVTPNFTAFAKSGAGELSLEDMAMHAAQNVTIDAGALALRTTSTPKPTSDGQGTIQIAAGGQLKVNISNGQNNLATIEPTHAKTVSIAGDGPDGQGALYNANPTTKSGEWSATFSHVVLTDDASVGGGAMGIREASGSAIPDAQLSGGHTFTVRTPLTSYYGFTLYSTAFAIDRIVNEGHLQLEGHGLSGTVTNGVHLTDGSLTKIFDTTIPVTVPLVVDADAKATVNAISGDSTINSSITVEDGATLTLMGDKGLKFNGVITNKGTIVKTTSSTEYYFNATMKGDGLLVNSNGWLRIDRDYTDDACRMRVDSGNVRFGGDATGVPLVPPAFDDLCGNAHFFFGQTTTIGSQYDTLVAQAAAHQKEIGVFTKNNVELILKGATWNLYDLTVADDNSAAKLVIDEGTTVTATHQVRNGGTATNSKNGVIELKAGGKLVTPNVNLIAGSLVQTGGELEIGADGLTAGRAKSVDDPHFRFEGGTLKATADFSVGNSVSTVFGGANFFDSSRAAAEGYTIDLNGRMVNWNAPIFGAGPLTLTGTGSFLTQANQTKYPMGTVTVATDPTANVDLSGVDAFTEGLTLAANAKATVKYATIPSIERVRLSGGNLTTWVATENVYDSVVTDFSEMNAASGSPAGTFYISYRGQFYVPADKAGVWHFVGGYDDASYLEIDGTRVGDISLDNNWTAKKTGSRELATGWHDFRLFFGQHTGGWGPSLLSNSKGKYAFGWTTDATAAGSTDGSKYEAFDPTTLEMRRNDQTDVKLYATVSTVRWQHDNRGTSDTNNLDDWMETTTTYDGTDQVLTTVKDLLCSASNTQLDSRRNRLSGYVYIPTTGTWKVKGKFDDKFCLRIDGEIAVWYGSFDREFANDNLPLTEGWHFFDIQIADTWGGYGATFTDSVGQICAVAFCAPESDQYLAFTEDNFKLRAFMPGLDGVTTLAAGSTLTSESSAYPIRGVLEGSGALAGGFIFEGGTWRVTANARALTEKVDVTDVTGSEFLKSLRNVEVVLTEQATRQRYELCAAGDLTNAEAAEITVTAVAAKGAPAGVLKSGTWRATVSNGVLWLVNPRPSGLVMYIR